MKQEERYKHYYNEGYNAGCLKGYEQAIKKACEWLEQNAYLYCDDIDTLHESALIGDFRKAMEGGEQ